MLRRLGPDDRVVLLGPIWTRMRCWAARPERKEKAANRHAVDDERRVANQRFGTARQGKRRAAPTYGTTLSEAAAMLDPAGSARCCTLVTANRPSVSVSKKTCANDSQSLPQPPSLFRQELVTAQTWVFVRSLEVSAGQATYRVGISAARRTRAKVVSPSVVRR